VTLRDLEAAVGAFLYDEWLKRIGWSRDDIARFFEHGIPAEYAASIADVTVGALPVSAWPKLIHPPKALHKRLRSSRTNVDMHADHRLAISRGHKGADGAFKKAIDAKGYTQNALARAIGINQAVLSLHRKKLRRIPLSRAKAIEKLTGWPADGRHWPCGIATDA
jgi:DNA-binding transcriptional regulator YdaS (Cro superfamily)